jgi:hypothetical protein
MYLHAHGSSCCYSPHGTFRHKRRVKLKPNHYITLRYVRLRYNKQQQQQQTSNKQQQQGLVSPLSCTPSKWGFADGFSNSHRFRNVFQPCGSLGRWAQRGIGGAIIRILGHAAGTVSWRRDGFGMVILEEYLFYFQLCCSYGIPTHHAVLSGWSGRRTS